jgi:hypothetical protein
VSDLTPLPTVSPRNPPDPRGPRPTITSRSVRIPCPCAPVGTSTDVTRNRHHRTSAVYPQRDSPRHDHGSCSQQRAPLTTIRAESCPEHNIDFSINDASDITARFLHKRWECALYVSALAVLWPFPSDAQGPLFSDVVLTRAESLSSLEPIPIRHTNPRRVHRGALHSR